MVQVEPGAASPRTQPPRD